MAEICRVRQNKRFVTEAQLLNIEKRLATIQETKFFRLFLYDFPDVALPQQVGQDIYTDDSFLAGLN